MSAKKVTIYECPICGERYNTEEEADRCEKYHIQVDCIGKTRYTPYYSENHPYPTIVYVKFKNGKTLKYVNTTGEEVNEY